MATYKLSSQELNKEFADKKNKIDEIQLTINNFKSDINKKLMIVNYALEIANNKLSLLGAGVNADQTLISFDNNVHSGMYEQYCYEIHPKFKSTPIDIFNLNLSNGGCMFKQNVKCTVNGVESDEWVNVLQSENIPTKTIVFDEYHTDTVEVAYTLDNTSTWGTSRFNLIEIDPYISGIHSIESIDCYTVDTANNLTAEPTKSFSNINNFGKTRLILDEKIKFGKVVFKFKCNYKSNINDSVVYPFGIKHIFFKEADFVTESCAIVHARFNDYVEYIEDKIVLYTPTGKIETNCSYYGIETYTTYENNTLMNKVQYSTNAGIYRIPKNTMSLYFKIPLYISNDADDTKEYLCLNGLKVNISTKDILVI